MSSEPPIAAGYVQNPQATNIRSTISVGDDRVVVCGTAAMTPEEALRYVNGNWTKTNVTPFIVKPGADGALSKPCKNTPGNIHISLVRDLYA